MKDRKDFLLGLCITLATIIFGLVSYIVYSEYILQNDTPDRCPYQGWSYENGETFDAGDDCNICVCNNGVVACTQKECVDLNLDNNPNE